MFVKRFQIFRAFGIPIYLDLSWFVVVLLISWSLADNVFQTACRGGVFRAIGPSEFPRPLASSSR